jgi:4-amino-4-deoxy-L-arabinose transferase-like glycosyltransferase
MSREMLSSSNWLYLYDIGTDYLDKPPFLFWVSALSMKLFGIHVWSYKLPSILFAIWAIYALYKFALLFYSEETAEVAALIFASCQAMFLVTNDIKTDTILLSFAVTAFWQLASWLYGKNKWGWIWGAVSIGGALITKGPIGLLIIGFGFLPHFIIKKEWKNLLRWQYLPMLVIIALILLPMSVGLYEQFDLQPDKRVNGGKNVSGLRFFYWTQSFGRITGESVWNNNAGFTFLYENLLWGLIPFTFFFVAATVKGFIKLGRRCFQTEWISTSAVVLAYLSLGMSKFQLPHYIYVVLPFICLLLARYYLSILHFFHHKFRILRVVHNFILYLFAALIPILFYIIFPNLSFWIYFVFLLFYILLAYIIYAEGKQKIGVLTTAVSISVLLNLLLNFIFYPQLIPYQKENTIAQKIENSNIPKNDIAVYNLGVGRSADFLLQHDLPIIGAKDILSYRYLITSDKGIAVLNKKELKFKTIHQGPSFHIARLTLPFLNPATREEATSTYYIVQLL